MFFYSVWLNNPSFQACVSNQIYYCLIVSSTAFTKIMCLLRVDSPWELCGMVAVANHLLLRILQSGVFTWAEPKLPCLEWLVRTAELISFVATPLLIFDFAYTKSEELMHCYSDSSAWIVYHCQIISLHKDLTEAGEYKDDLPQGRQESLGWLLQERKESLN